MEKHPVKARVTGKEKRYKPTKRYVFIVQVWWSDGSKVPIYREYSEFFQLNAELKELLPNLSPNANCPKEIQLPDFPTKKAFERSEVSKVASVRRNALDGYCQAVLQCSQLAKHATVGEFFSPRNSDINPERAEKDRPQRSSILSALTQLMPKKDGDMTKSKLAADLWRLGVEPLDEGPEISGPLILEIYMVTADYMPQEKGEVQLKEDHYVQVIEKHPTGWWFLSTEYGDGWGPATHLSPVDQPETEDEPEPIYQGSKYITTNSYKAPESTKDELSFPQGAMVDVLHKLLDGWWIIKYQCEVGYAPATYLAPFRNPHYKESRYGLRQNRRPTQRKTLVKNSKGQSVCNLRDRSRDLSIYKKLSLKKECNTLPESPTKSVAFDNLNSANTNTIQKDQNADGNVISIDGVTSTETDDTIGRAKLSRRSAMMRRTLADEKSMSVESDNYEYLDEEEMECVTDWVSENILRQKQMQEQSNKESTRDYMNIPRLSVQPVATSSSSPSPSPDPTRRHTTPALPASPKGNPSQLNASPTEEGKGFNTAPQLPPTVRQRAAEQRARSPSPYRQNMDDAIEGCSKESGNVLNNEQHESVLDEVQDIQQTICAADSSDPETVRRNSLNSNDKPVVYATPNRAGIKSNKTVVNNDGIVNSKNTATDTNPQEHSNGKHTEVSSIEPFNNNEIAHVVSICKSCGGNTSPGTASPMIQENPEHSSNIKLVLRQISDKQISRIYQNSQGELVIKFAKEKDAADFAMCDIRDDTCPIDPPPSQELKTPSLSSPSGTPTIRTAADLQSSLSGASVLASIHDLVHEAVSKALGATRDTNVQNAVQEAVSKAFTEPKGAKVNEKDCKEIEKSTAKGLGTKKNDSTKTKVTDIIYI